MPLSRNTLHNKTLDLITQPWYSQGMPAQAAKPRDLDLLPGLKRQYPDIDFDKFIALNNDGYSSYELANEFAISQGKAWRIQSKLSDIKQGLTHFKDNKLDYMSEAQFQALALQAKVVEYYLQDSKFNQLKDKERIMLLDATNRIAGTLEDKQNIIINVKGNLNINQINLSPEESALLQSRAIDLVSAHRCIPANAITIDAQVIESEDNPIV